MKQKLEEFFQLRKYEIKVSDLVRMLNLDSKEVSTLIEELYNLEKEGKIYYTDRQTYIYVPKENYLYHGVIRKSNKNKYYIDSKNKIINISNKDLNGAKENDTVFVEIKNGTKPKHIKQLEGTVVRKVERVKVSATNTFYKSEIKKDYARGYYYTIINNKSIYIADIDLRGAVVGDTVTVQVNCDKNAKVVDIITRKNKRLILECRNIKGRLLWTPIDSPNNVIDVIFNKQINFKENDRILVDFIDNKAVYSDTINLDNSFQSKIKAMLYNTGMPIDFSKEAMDEVIKMQDVNIENLKDRCDFRNLTTITIDGKNAKDLDDAISLEYIDGIYTLYVHIADVSYFVRPGTKIFEEAYERSTSVYPSNYVFPMLPKELSNGICSLNPNVDRLTKTCIIRFDSKGNKIDYKFVNTIINSNYRMDYELVNEILRGENIPDGYKEYVDLLNEMNALSKMLQDQKKKRGALLINNLEYNFDLNENEEIQKITTRDREEAELLIENFMLEANTSASEFVRYLQVPFMFRNHERPDVDQIKKLKNSLNSLKKSINILKNLDNLEILSSIVSKISEKDPYESMYYSNKILDCLKRAYYSSENKGHYGLALSNYATFTSPIRRFPDLLNHYVIGEILEGRINEVSEDFKNIEELCKHASSMQYLSDSFEKQVNNLLLNKYLLQFIDKELEAEILFIDQDYVGIKTSNNLYGNINIKKNMCKNHSFSIDGVSYEVGSTILVKVNNVDDINNQINFDIISKKVKQLKKGRKN